jgi:hypothetical protein
MTQRLQTIHKNTNCCLICLRYHANNMNRWTLYYLYDQILYSLYAFRIFPMSWWAIPRFRDHHIVEDIRNIWILYGWVTHHFKRTVNGVKRLSLLTKNAPFYYCKIVQSWFSAFVLNSYFYLGISTFST